MKSILFLILISSSAQAFGDEGCGSRIATFLKKLEARLAIADSWGLVFSPSERDEARSYLDAFQPSRITSGSDPNQESEHGDAGYGASGHSDTSYGHGGHGDAHGDTGYGGGAEGAGGDGGP